MTHAVGGRSPSSDGAHDKANRSRQDGRLRARTVTYGAVALLLVVGVARIEAWPLTSLHLFSNVRTDTATVTRLYAVMDDGSRSLVVLDSHDPVMRTTSHQYGRLADVSRLEQEEMIQAWLRSAAIDSGRVRAVQVENVRRVMDPDSRTWSETSRDLVVEVGL